MVWRHVLVYVFGTHNGCYLRILITGAGIGGLTAALACLQRGLDVDVYEQAPVLAEVGAGVQISANGSRVLIELGLGEALQKCWVEPTGKEIRLWSTGQTWKLFDLGSVSRARYGAPYFMIHRADLHRALFDAVCVLKPDAVHLNSHCVGFKQDDFSVEAHFAGSQSQRGDVLIGADGVHSRIRDQIIGADHPHFTGCVAWRGLVPAERLPAEFLRPVGVNWIGPGGHIVTYPIRQQEMLNFVGVVERSNWLIESWTEKGTHQECQADFSDWHAEIHEIIRNLDTPYKWALFGREPLARWSVGRVTLLGDAAHPTLPMLAQGANMAIEDSMVLSRCLRECDLIVSALQQYDEIRCTRANTLVRGALDNAKRFHNPILADAVGAQHYVDTEWREDKVKQRYDWIFEYDARAAGAISSASAASVLSRR